MTHTMDKGCISVGASISNTSEKLIIFSIASRNYMAYSNVLFESVKRHHPEAEFFLALADSDDDIDRDSVPYEIINLWQLEDDRVWSMAEKYNITEFNTSIKPFVFSLLMERFPGAVILYFDPDILIVSPLEELIEQFSRGANCVLTPHLLQPSGHLWSPDEAMLKYGIYNLGFVGMRGNAETFAIVNWWADRMENRCLIDFPNGLFVDQKWCDLIPAMLSNTVVLRHGGYNTAYWNLVQRDVKFENQVWLCNGELLRFVHFSGFDPLNPGILSRHASSYHHMLIGDLAMLLEFYRERVLKLGLKSYGSYNYAFRYSGNSGAVNVHTDTSLSTKLKGDRGLVDHPLPAFGEYGSDVPDSVGKVSAPRLKTVLLHREDDLKAFRQKNRNLLDEKRAYEAKVVGKGGEVSLADGVCSMCRATTPFLVEVKSVKGRRTSDWSRTVSCRCGHELSSRALVHAMLSIAPKAANGTVLIDATDTGLCDWAQLNLMDARSINGALPDSADVILVQRADLASSSVSSLVANYLSCLRPGGLIVIFSLSAGDSSDSLEINFSFIEQLGQAGFIKENCILFWSEEYAYLGENTHIFTARKATKDNVLEANFTRVVT